jgi:hypothetical protein
MRIFLIIFIISLLACTTPRMIMKSWVGHTEQELLSHWGTPTKTIENGSNGRILVYVPDMNNKNGVNLRYVNTGRFVEHIPPRSNEFKKTKSFYVTPMGNIYAWKMK